jgi:hypothetical protein
MSPEESDAWDTFFFETLSWGERQLYDDLPLALKKRIGASYDKFLRATEGMTVPRRPVSPTSFDGFNGINGKVDLGEHEEDAGEDEMELEGFQRISPEEYFSGMVAAASEVTLDNAKHMRLVAQNGHKIAVERGDSDIAAGFADVLDAANARIAEDYDVDNVSQLVSSELASDATLKSKDAAEETGAIRESRTSLIDDFAHEHDPVELMNHFKAVGKNWKTFALPRFSKDAHVTEEYDHRQTTSDHDHLTYFYAVTKHMQNVASDGKITAKETKAVSKEFTKYTETLASGMQVSLRNQLRNWKSGIKFLVMRGVASMYGEEYGRTTGSMDKTREIENKFSKDFNEVMRRQIALEKSAIDFQSKAWQLGSEAKDDSEFEKKSTELREAALKHASEKVAPFWARLVLFSLGQPKASVEKPIGQQIQKSFADAWSAHADKTLTVVKTLANTGFQKDPVKLKANVEIMFSDGDNLGTLINSYVYGMAGEPAPSSVVRRLIATAEL